MEEDDSEGIRGKMWRIVKNLYDEVGSCVRLGEEKTEWFSLEIGYHPCYFLFL